MKTLNYPQPGAPMQGYATVPATSDAKEYLRLLLRHKFGLVLTFLLGLGLAWLYLISTEKVYEASALLQVNEVEDPFDNGDKQVDWNAPTIKEEANLLRSRRVLSPVVDAYNMRINADAVTVPVLGEVTKRIPVLADAISGFDFAKRFAWSDNTIEVATLEVPRRWEDQALKLVSLGDGAYSLYNEEAVLIERAQVGETVDVDIPNLEPLTISLSALDAPEGLEYTLERSSLQTTVARLRDELSTETSDTNSRMITIKLKGNDPSYTAELTNAIVTEYESVKLGTQNLKLDNNGIFYEQRLPEVETDLRAAEVALADFRKTSATYDSDVQRRSKLGQIDKLETRLLDLEIEIADQLKRYTISHPTPKRTQKEIDTLRASIRSLRGQISRAPDTERELRILEEDVDAKRALFTEMNEKVQELRLARGGSIPAVQVIDDALAPRKPIAPNSLLAIVGGTLATLFLYTLYLTLRSALTTVISDQDSLERASGLPVFMNIPKSSAQKRLASPVTVDPRRLLPGSGEGQSAADSNVLALTKPEDYSIENLRGLRSMLDDVMAGASNNVLMITSPLPSMGKSFVSMNLAVLVAQSGKRVLLIDADYQRGQMHKTLGVPMGPGLPEVVSGKSELKESVRQTSVENLYCIPRGFGGAQGEMPTEKQFGQFMHVVAPRFDVAIVDTPPVLSVSTAASLGKHAGSTIMVVKEGEVKEPQLNEALRRLTFSGVRVSGCILNGSSSPTPRHYTYYREQLD